MAAGCQCNNPAESLKVQLICSLGMHRDTGKVEMTGPRGWSDEECERDAQRSSRAFPWMRMVMLRDIRKSRERRAVWHICSQLALICKKTYVHFYISNLNFHLRPHLQGNRKVHSSFKLAGEWHLPLFSMIQSLEQMLSFHPPPPEKLAFLQEASRYGVMELVGLPGLMMISWR